MENQMINEIILRRKNKLLIPSCTTHFAEKDKRAVFAVMKNIQSLGFTFGEDVYSVIEYYTKEELETFYKELIPILKKIRGADVEYNPMYPNFPEQVIEADDFELFMNAIIHYWSFGKLLPEYKKDERLPLFDNPELEVLTIGTIDDMWEIFSNLLSSKTSISEADRNDIEYIVSNYADYYKHLPEEIPMKENVAFLCKTIINVTGEADAEKIQKYFKTATDVLRLVVSMSDGDISLASRTRFRKLRRKERRMIMNLLAGCGEHIKEDMFKYQNEWIRVGEIVHPGEYHQGKYAGVREAFSAIRSDNKPMFMSGAIQESIKSGDITKAVALLKLRPGEFARQLDKLLRDAKNCNFVVNTFAQVANTVSTTVLLNVRQHFLDRGNEKALRVVMPKGSTAKAYSIPRVEAEIDDKVCADIVKICEHALKEQYSNRDYLGNVYIDEEFKNYVAPFSQRSASTSGGKELVRGSRISVPDVTNCIRGFIWWTNPKSGCRTDIDLSASLFNADWEYLDHVSWTELRNMKYGVYHSGDITDGGDFNGKGVSEFIDIDIEKAVANGARYAIFTLHGYTSEPFSKCEHLRFGWMNREYANSGEIYEPSTVECSIDVNAQSRAAIPVVFDLIEREFVWCDLVLAGALNERVCGNTIEGNLTGVKAACYAIMNIRKPSLYDVIKLNAEARGKIVDNVSQADIVFTNEDIIIPDCTGADIDNDTVIIKNVPIIKSYDNDYYMGQML